MTDVGIRRSVPGLDGQHPAVALRNPARRNRTGSLSLLPWDLLAAAAAAAAMSATSPIAAPRVVVLLLCCWGACLVLARASEISLVGSRAHAFVRVLRAGGAFALAGSALSLVPGTSLTTGEAFAAAASTAGISCAARAVVLVWPSSGCVLVVGDAADCRHVVAALERRAGTGAGVASVCLESADVVGPSGELTVPLRDVPAYARRVGAHTVVAVPAAGLDPVELRRLQWVLEGSGLPFFVATGLVGTTASRLTTTDVGGLPLMRVRSATRSGPVSLLVDWAGRCLAGVALVLLAPILLLLVLAIRRESPGPAVYRQVRVGQDGRLFTMFKLRTMTTDRPVDLPLENDCDGPLFKMRDDPRITRLGGLLRKYSLDELPQLVNVVLGQMRLVGPRPALPEEVAEYTEVVRRRLAVSPGVTGLWQVSGRSDLTWEETVRLDLHYVDNWSPWQDLSILCRTVVAVLGHRGAY